MLSEKLCTMFVEKMNKLDSTSIRIIQNVQKESEMCQGNGLLR